MLRAAGFYLPFDDFHLQSAGKGDFNPWYSQIDVSTASATDSAEPVSPTSPTSIWEGVLTGWYFSQLGGGADNRPSRSDGGRPQAEQKQDVSFDNSDTTVAEDLVVGTNDIAVPTVFNGNFEWGTRQQVFLNSSRGRFPASFQLPGFSFHGGEGYRIDSVPIIGPVLQDVTAAFIFDVGGFMQQIVKSGLDFLGEQLLSLVEKGLKGAIPEGHKYKQQLENLAENWQDVAGLGGFELSLDGITSKLAALVYPQETNHALMVGVPDVIKRMFNPQDPKHSADRLAGDKTPVTQLVHNRQLIPDKTALEFELVVPFIAIPDTSIRVYIELIDESGSRTFELGSPKLEPIDALFPLALDPRNREHLRGKKFRLEVPEEVKGHVGQVIFEFDNIEQDLGFDLEAGLSSLISQFFFIDNIRFVDYLSDVQVPEEVKEAEEFAVSVEIEAGGQDAPSSIRVDWGDDSPASVKPYSPGTAQYTFTHQYADDGPSPGNFWLSDMRRVKVTVTKGDEVLDEVKKSISVKNEAPQITSLLLDRAEIDEDQQVVLTGTFTDNGLQDRHWVVIDWGDGFPASVLSPADLPGDVGSAVTTFTISHRYQDDGPLAAKPGNFTSQDDMPIRVIVVDDDYRFDEAAFDFAEDFRRQFESLYASGEPDALATAATTVRVRNVAPEIVSWTVTPEVDEGRKLVVAGTFRDASAYDWLTLVVDWGDQTAPRRLPFPARNDAVPPRVRVRRRRNVSRQRHDAR